LNTDFPKVQPDHTERLRYLNENALFTDLPEAAIEAFLDRTRVLTLGKEEILYEDTDTSRSVFLVGRGLMRFLVRTERNVDFMETGRCEAGAFFGEGAALEYLDGHPRRPLLSRARIVADEPSVLLVVPAELLGEALRAYPVAMATNLTRAASQKSRRSVQGQFDAAIQGETVRILDSILGWLSRRTLDAIGAIQLNAGVLRENGTDPRSAEIGQELLEACSNLDQTFLALADMAREEDGPSHAYQLPVDSWWREFSPNLNRILEARGGSLHSYVERATIATAPRRLERAFIWCFDSISRVMHAGEVVAVTGGPSHGSFEFKISFRFPMLTEFLARRLLLPFAVQGDYADICVGLALSRRLITTIGGSLEVEQRSGEQLTLALNLPTQAYEEA